MLSIMSVGCSHWRQPPGRHHERNHGEARQPDAGGSGEGGADAPEVV